MKKNNGDLKFSTLKIKKIIQENKEIGKIANMTPYVICKFLFNLAKSLEYFLKDLLIDCSNRAIADSSNKIYCHHMYYIYLFPLEKTLFYQIQI